MRTSPDYDNSIYRGVYYVRVAYKGRLSPDQIAGLMNGADFAHMAVLGEEYYEMVVPDEELLKVICDNNLVVERSTSEFDTFRHEYALAYRDYCRAVVEYDKTFDTYSFRNTDTDPEAGIATKPVERSEQTTDTVTLKQVVDQHIQEAALGKQWATGTTLEKQGHFDLLYEVLGSAVDVSKVSLKDAQSVKSVVTKMPKNRHKLAATKGKTVAELMEMTGLETIGVPTINKYLQTYSTLFGWAQKNGYVEANHFSGISLRQGARNKNKREHFNEGEVTRILDALVGPETPLVKKPYQKWGPLIGLFTGMRLGEVCQLRLSDFKSKDGVPYFDVNEEEDDKSVKSPAGVRKVPVHAKLVEFGLLDYVESLRLAGSDRLFPDFRYNAKYGWGRSLSRWFNERFLPELGLKTGKLVFHSLRHTVVTELLRANVPMSQVQSLVGHELQSVTEKHYLGGYTMEQLSSAIHRLPYGLDTDNVVAMPIPKAQRAGV